jgi:hypothetical protein
MNRKARSAGLGRAALAKAEQGLRSAKGVASAIKTSLN